MSRQIGYTRVNCVGVRLWEPVLDGFSLSPVALWGARGVRRNEKEDNVKVSASVKRRCQKCRIIRRRGTIMVICSDPRHKQKQG